MLRNTWTAVSGLVAEYQGTARAYVLDDGPSDAARSMCEAFGFCYVRRPDLRVYKKSGNLRHAFARSDGDYLVIFDADFAPRRDFLAETLPYLDDPGIAIVQTPQFFRGSATQTWIENAAARSRRRSTDLFRWPATGSAPPSASAPRRSTGGRRWNRTAARRSSPMRRTCTRVWTCAEMAGPWFTCRSCSRLGSARTTWTRLSASSTGGARGTRE